MFSCLWVLVVYFGTFQIITYCMYLHHSTSYMLHRIACKYETNDLKTEITLETITWYATCWAVMVNIKQSSYFSGLSGLCLHEH